MKTTGNYGLKKPDGNDVVNIDDLNYNSDVIDRKLKEVENKASNIKVPVTSVNGKTGNVVLTADNIKVEGSKSLKSQFDDMTTSIGNKSSLKTSNKTNLVNAINELFTSGNNVKSNTVDALLRLDDSLQLSRNSNWSEIIKQIANVETGYGVGDIIEPNNIEIVGDNVFKHAWNREDVDLNADIIIDSDSNIYFSDGSTLFEMSKEGKDIWKSEYGYKSYWRITKLAIDKNDNIYYGNDDGTVSKISSTDLGGRAWYKYINFGHYCDWYIDDILISKSYLYVTGYYHEDGVKDQLILKMDIDDGNIIWGLQPNCSWLEIAIDNEGFLWYYNNDFLRKISNDGETILEIPLAIEDSEEIAFDKQNNIIMSYSSNIVKMSCDGKQIWRIINYDVADGSLYVDNNNDILTFSLNKTSKISSKGNIDWSYRSWGKNATVDEKSKDIYFGHMYGITKVILPKIKYKIVK
ncbi:hypothetical protein [Clostridium oceanicum]|uniref:Uncharacterized protein n=1 Tax=Clostridium oceanicum TaxID=1543 RepID=A0ABP3UM25_9CLOT